MPRYIAQVKDRSKPVIGVVGVLAVVAALAIPAAANAQNSISYVGDTVTVGVDPDGATVEYSAFGFFFCFPFPCVPPPPDYDISSPQGFTSMPGACSDPEGNQTAYDCDPVPAETVINGSAVRDTIEAGCFIVSSRLILEAGGGDDVASSACSGSDIDMGAGNDSATLSSSGDVDGGDGNDTATGGGGANTLLGGGGKDTLRGGAGDDALDGGDGSDTLDGEAGNDTLRGNLRRDLLIGGAGADVLEGGADFDTVSYEDKTGAQPVTISLTAAAGDDGEPGEGDTIGGDVENVIGSAGADTITGDGAPNDLVGLDNGDVIIPGGGPDIVDAGPGNDRVEARDGAQDRIECGDGNDLAITDEFDSVSNCEQVQASRDLMPDVDADGVPAPADCDDRDGRLRPGFIDRPGNGLDEDCTGADAPFIRILSPVQSAFSTLGRVTRVRRLRVLAVPEGGTVELRCRGGRRRGCFRGVKRFRSPRGHETRNIRRPVRKRRLRPRAVLEVRILDADSIGRVVRFTMRRSRAPRSQTRCLVPGQNSPGRCPRN